MTTEVWTKTTIRLEHKGYVGGAERDASGYLQGFVEDLNDSTVIYDGNDLAELAAGFVAAVDEYLADCEAEGITAEAPKSLAIA
jgi:predicted HicB family RNase H-like nuclease